MAMELVDYTQTEKGAMAALVPMFGEEASIPTFLDKDDDILRGTPKFVSNSLSVTTAARLKVGTIFQGKTDIDNYGFYYDSMLFIDKKTPDSNTDSVIRTTRWGIGLRILIRVYDVKISTSLDVGMIGGAVEIGVVKAGYEIVAPGFGLEGYKAILEGFPPTGTLNRESHQKILSEISPRFVSIMESPDYKPYPVVIAVELQEPTDLISNSRSVFFAMKSIADRHEMNRVLQSSNLDLNREIIKLVYKEIAGDINTDQKPSRNAQDIAEDWLKMK